MYSYDCYVWYSRSWEYICTVKANDETEAIKKGKNYHGALFNYKWKAVKS